MKINADWSHHILETLEIHPGLNMSAEQLAKKFEPGLAALVGHLYVLHDRGFIEPADAKSGPGGQWLSLAVDGDGKLLGGHLKIRITAAGHDHLAACSPRMSRALGAP